MSNELKRGAKIKAAPSVVVRTWPSSKPGKSYELRLADDGVMYCTCMAWRFSKEIPKTCKHMGEYIQAIVTNGAAFMPKDS